MRKREKRTNDDCMNSFLMIENHSTMLIRKDVLLSLSSSPFPHECFCESVVRERGSRSISRRRGTTHAWRRTSAHRGSAVSLRRTTTEAATTRRHVHGTGTTNASHRTLQAWSARWRDAASGGATHAHSRHSCRHGNACLALLGRRRALDRHGNHVFATNEDETQGSLLFLLRPFGFSGLELPELLAVGENQIHVFVKGLELADECASVLENDAHSIVQMRRHFVTLAHRHFGGRK